jgi:hypothetical protein
MNEEKEDARSSSLVVGMCVLWLSPSLFLSQSLFFLVFCFAGGGGDVV